MIKIKNKSSGLINIDNEILNNVNNFILKISDFDYYIKDSKFDLNINLIMICFLFYNNLLFNKEELNDSPYYYLSKINIIRQNWKKEKLINLFKINDFTLEDNNLNILLKEKIYDSFEISLINKIKLLNNLDEKVFLIELKNFWNYFKYILNSISYNKNIVLSKNINYQNELNNILLLKKNNVYDINIFNWLFKIELLRKNNSVKYIIKRNNISLFYWEIPFINIKENFIIVIFNFLNILKKENLTLIFNYDIKINSQFSLILQDIHYNINNNSFEYKFWIELKEGIYNNIELNFLKIEDIVYDIINWKFDIFIWKYEKDYLLWLLEKIKKIEIKNI